MRRGHVVRFKYDLKTSIGKEDIFQILNISEKYFLGSTFLHSEGIITAKKWDSFPIIAKQIRA